MKNLLTQWETEKENRKIGGNVSLIDREFAKLENGIKCAFFPKFTKLENDTKYASFSNLTKLVKKSFKLIKTGKEKSYCSISRFWLILLSLSDGIVFVL